MILHQYDETPCPGMNCGSTDGKHSKECIAEHCAAPAGGDFVKWISVEDRLPETPYEDVLVFPRPTDYCCEAHVNGRGEWMHGEYEKNYGHRTYPCQVTHWMPLPAPPVPNK